MIKNYSVRTDLALEEKERFESDHVEISGVVLEEDYDEASELRVTRVEIKTENGAKAMGKPVGTYLTAMHLIHIIRLDFFFRLGIKKHS